MEMLQQLLGLFMNAEWYGKLALGLGVALSGAGLAQTALLFIAPKTKTTLDDKALGYIQKYVPLAKKLHGFLKQEETKKKTTKK